MPLLAPKNDINWSAFVESKFTPTLIEFATLVVFAAIHSTPLPVDESIFPEPEFPFTSLREPFIFKSPLVVVIPVKFALRAFNSSRLTSPTIAAFPVRFKSPERVTLF